MSTLAEHWDQWTEHERNMMLTALDWNRRVVHGHPAFNVGLLPFIAKREVLSDVQFYIQIVVIENGPEFVKWNQLVARLKKEK